MLLFNLGLVAVGAAAQSSPSWQSYVRGPFSNTVLPASIVSAQTYGSVTNPDALLTAGGDTTTLSRSASPSTGPPSWPAGTTADASSYSAPNTVNGQARTYDPSNAIDGDLNTFWNDNTQGTYPDVLTITPPSAVSLPGITIESNSDGVPTALTVEVEQDGQWITAGSVTGNTNVRIPITFSSTLSASAVRITITQDQSTSAGEFTRINEVWPAIVAIEIPSVVVDFGQNVVGFLNINFAGASTNSPGIRLAFSETLQYLSDVSDFTRSQNGDTITPGSDQIAVSSSAYTWTDANGCAQGTQVCADGLHGFRYVKIYLDALSSDAPYTSTTGTVDIDSISLNYAGYVGTPDSYSGWFECSDSVLTQQWYDGSHTNEMTIATFTTNDVDPRGADSASLDGKTVLLDGAKRDRDPYSGDLAVSARTLYLTHDVPEAARNVLADLADHQRDDGFIPPASLENYGLTLFDYPLWWVACSYDLMVYTGDVAYVQQYYGALVKVLDTWYPSVTNPANSLLSKGLNNTSGYGDYAFLSRSDEVTYYNALYVLALKNAASMAQAVGQTDDANRWLGRALTVAQAVDSNLWDAQTGAYLDSLSGPQRHAQDGNALSVVAGLASAAQTSSLLSYFASLALPYGNPFYDNDSIGADFSKRVYAYISYFEIQARFLSGSASTALEQIRRMYNWMSVRDPGITFWEGIGTGGSLYEGTFTSAAHGWSTGIVPALTNFVLGVIPTGPGFATWTVKPMPGDLTWAQGVVPTPAGPFNVSWTTRATGLKFSLDINVPSGTSGDASVPVSDSSDTVSVDGQQVWDGTKATESGVSSADGYVTVPLTSGQHVVEVN